MPDRISFTISLTISLTKTMTAISIAHLEIDDSSISDHQSAQAFRYIDRAKHESFSTSND